MLDPLADTTDLEARGITVPDGMNADALLQSASDAVRDAAGTSITRNTSTIKVVANQHEVDLPAGPVWSVSSVMVGDTAVVGWENLGDKLCLPWATVRRPIALTVTYDHGYTIIPADVIDLVCGMVAIASSGEYGGGNTVSASIKLGDYSESETKATGSASPSPMELPDGVRNRLRARFGGT